MTATREFLTWAVHGAQDRGELPSATSAATLVDTLAAIFSGIGFYAGYVGTPRQIHAIVAQIQQLLAGNVWPSSK